MTLSKTAAEMVADARARIEEVETPDLIAQLTDPDVIVVDIRDIRERQRGFIPGSVHAPRGMIEFWVDPDSPYFKEWLADESKTYVLYCQSAWRSALAVADLMDMGAENIAHVEGGFRAWKEAGHPVAERPKKKG